MREKEKEEKERRGEKGVRKGSKSHKDKGEKEKELDWEEGEEETGRIWIRRRDLKQSENQKEGEEWKQTNKQISGKERHQ